MTVTVRYTGMIEEFGPYETAEEVQVSDEDRPWLEINMGVQHWNDDDVVLFRLASVHMVSKNFSESKPTTVLREGEWWTAVLDAVLEYVAFNSIAFDRAAERSEGAFTYEYGWEDGDVKQAEIRPANPAT